MLSATTVSEIQNYGTVITRRISVVPGCINGNPAVTTIRSPCFSKFFFKATLTARSIDLSKEVRDDIGGNFAGTNPQLNDKRCKVSIDGENANTGARCR